MKHSVRIRMSVAIIAIVTATNIVTAMFGYQIYKNALRWQYQNISDKVVKIASHFISGDSVKRYAATLKKDDEYDRTLSVLKILQTESSLQFLTVIAPDEESGHEITIFSTDTGRLGYTAWENYETYKGDFDTISAAMGEPVAVTEKANNGAGWLMSVYQPVYDSGGVPCATIVSSFAYENITNQEHAFLIGLAFATTGATIAVVAVFLIAAEKIIIRPVTIISQAVENWNYIDRSATKTRKSKISELNFETKDEMYLLSEAIKKMENQIIETITELKIDPLTRLYNRRTFNDCLSDWFDDYKNEGAVFTLIIIDIDNFKDINEKYGENFSDNVLKKLAETLKSELNCKDDLIFRYGGNKFALLICAEENVGGHVAEKLRGVWSETAVEHRSAVPSPTGEAEEKLYFTISAGVCGVNKNINGNSEIVSAREVFRKADRALRTAKNTGKNKIITASLEEEFTPKAEAAPGAETTPGAGTTPGANTASSGNSADSFSGEYI